MFRLEAAMTTETRWDKARRLIDSGQIALMEIRDDVTPTTYVYEVVGDSGVYRVEADKWGVDCPCPSYKRCSHAIGVRMFEVEIGLALAEKYNTDYPPRLHP